MRTARRLLVAGLLSLALLAGLVAGSMLLSPSCADLAPPDRFDVAIVLSRGGNGVGGLDAGSLDRTDAAVGLWSRGMAERLLMTGDVFDGPTSAAGLMRDRAVAGGVPVAQVLIEPEAHSTLQNARFSLDLIPPDARVVLVTEGFHLWRGWASFAWAGHVPQAICQSSPIVPRNAQTIRDNLPREVAAWAVNLVRATLWSAADAMGATDRLPPSFLD